MLPVPHHACTLATGALRSACTITVSPLGKIHFCAVMGGNVSAAALAGAVEFSAEVVNIAGRRTQPPRRFDS